MKPKFWKIIFRSLLYYRKDAVYQIIITIILSAIITGSFFTGHSVRGSLKRTSAEKLGNTDIIISSGLRYFNHSLADKISESSGNRAVSVLETEGYCSNFLTGTTALNVKIYGVNEDFFRFNSADSIVIQPEEAGLNIALARHLSITEGEEIIVRFREVDPLPSNAPFSPSKKDHGSIVLKISRIIPGESAGNFSPGVTQQIPFILFMNMSEPGTVSGKEMKANRILINHDKEADYKQILGEAISPDDIGLTLRRSDKTGETELISDRIFLDNLLVSEILEMIPEGKPVLTYLVNNFRLNNRSTPYSFISALPSDLLSDIDSDEIIINRWMADDLNASEGEKMTLTWYDPIFSKRLEEKSRDFYIRYITENDSRYSDSLLMPDFPGISGSATCSGWDAGIPVLMDQIRLKDEDYWNRYRGMPKAFISYETGRMLWGNNFGTATSIRFPASLSPEEIKCKLKGSLDPEIVGFTITNARESAEKGAEQSVDFSLLFLSLSFFMIISCLILFSLAVSMYFDTRKKQAGTMYALGFRNMDIRKLLFAEALLLSVTGAVPGAFLGYLVNILIIKALNSVWIGAVQTSSLAADFGIAPLLYGFLIVMSITAVMILIKSCTFTGNLINPVKEELKKHSFRKNILLFGFFITLAILLLIAALILHQNSTPLYFAAGSFLFAALVSLISCYYIKDIQKNDVLAYIKNNIMRKYYAFHPSHIVTPVIFIAAGIFAVIITGANRMVLTDKMLLPEGGTGGYLLWAESAVPIIHDLNSPEGIKEFGLNEEKMGEMEIMQCTRLAGDDASCLNLNQVSTPPLLGIDASEFIRRSSFSFASRMKKHANINPWELLDKNPGQNMIYGIADQSVLQWGLKIRTGDTLVFRTESGQNLGIIICAGLKSSLFQGSLLISKENLSMFFPSVEGGSVFLIDGNPELSEHYRNTLEERLSGYGFSAQEASEKLASFFQVTNTYLDVFAILGAFGMIMGIAGLGFVLLRNYNIRRCEFAYLSATGFSEMSIRRMILKDQLIILFWGVITGTISGLTATAPSIINGNVMPWGIILIMIISIVMAGSAVLYVSVRSVRSKTLISQLRMN